MVGDSASTDQIARRLREPAVSVVLGIDGYIDEVWRIVASRRGVDDYASYDKMADFAGAVLGCGTGGYSNEIVRLRRGHGGFTANTGAALGRLGVCPTLIGMFGETSIDAAFQVLEPDCRLISVGDPAVSHIFEFNDGKILLPHIESIMRFTWNTLLGSPSWDAVRAALAQAQLIGLGYWSLMPAFDDVLSRLCGEFVDGGVCTRLFFDFADVRKRDADSLQATLRLLGERGRRVPMSLSLNEHEAELVSAVVCERFAQSAADALRTTERVRTAIGIDELIVHTPRFAVASTAHEGSAAVDQRYCEHPVLTTGAGDNFNAGYIAATMADLDLRQRLLVANAATGFYVANGRSPDVTELCSNID